MAFEFEFKGGVVKPTAHQIEKFLLFFVIGGEEIPFYQLMKDSLIVQMTEATPKYSTGNGICKLFISEQGFGIAKRYTSFYMRLLSGARPDVIVHPFSLERSSLYFKAKVSFLKKSQVLKILGEENPSRRFVENQRTLPIDTLQKMIKINRSELRKGVRHVRVGENGH